MMTLEQLNALQTWTWAMVRSEVHQTAVSFRDRDHARQKVLDAFGFGKEPAPDRYATPGIKEAQHAALYALLNKGVPAFPIGCSKLAAHLMDIWPEMKAIMEPEEDATRPSPEELDAWGDKIREEGLAGGSLAICKSCGGTFLVATGHDCPGIERRTPCA